MCYRFAWELRFCCTKWVPAPSNSIYFADNSSNWISFLAYKTHVVILTALLSWKLKWWYKCRSQCNPVYIPTSFHTVSSNIPTYSEFLTFNNHYLSIAYCFCNLFEKSIQNLRVIVMRAAICAIQLATWKVDRNW